MGAKASVSGNGNSLSIERRYQLPLPMRAENHSAKEA